MNELQVKRETQFVSARHPNSPRTWKRQFCNRLCAKKKENSFWLMYYHTQSGTTYTMILSFLFFWFTANYKIVVFTSGDCKVILQPSADLFQKAWSVKNSLYSKETVLLISLREPNLSELRCDPSTMRCNRSIVDAYYFMLLRVQARCEWKRLLLANRE